MGCWDSAFTVFAEGFPSVALEPVHAAHSGIEMESCVSLKALIHGVLHIPCCLIYEIFRLIL